jgi:hypothetical protein
MHERAPRSLGDFLALVMCVEECDKPRKDIRLDPISLIALYIHPGLHPTAVSIREGLSHRKFLRYEVVYGLLRVEEVVTPYTLYIL